MKHLKGRLPPIDCERDVKGIHQWELAGLRASPTGNAQYTYWCSCCGALGECGHVTQGREIRVIKRIEYLK